MTVVRLDLVQPMTAEVPKQLVRARFGKLRGDTSVGASGSRALEQALRPGNSNVYLKAPKRECGIETRIEFAPGRLYRVPRPRSRPIPSRSSGSG